MSKLKEYKKLKNQKKMTEEEILKIFEKKLKTSEEVIIFLKQTIENKIFKIKVAFLIKTAEKEAEKYRANGNYEKYEKENFYTNGKSGFSEKKRGYLKGVKKEIFKYKFKDEDNENHEMIKVLKFEKIKKD
jgi:hypothetical protein